MSEMTMPALRRALEERLGRKVSYQTLWMVRREHGERAPQPRRFATALLWTHEAVDQFEALLRERWNLNRSQTVAP